MSPLNKMVLIAVLARLAMADVAWGEYGRPRRSPVRHPSRAAQPQRGYRLYANDAPRHRRGPRPTRSAHSYSNRNAPRRCYPQPHKAFFRFKETLLKHPAGHNGRGLPIYQRYWR